MRVLQFLENQGQNLFLIFLAALGALAVFSVETYLDTGIHPALYLVCMCLIHGIYLLNRVTDAGEDLSNDSERTGFYLKRNFHLSVSAALISIALLTVLWSKSMNWIYVLLLGTGICYSFEIVPWIHKGKLELIRIKSITGMKNVVVAFLWGGCVVAIPGSWQGQIMVDRLDLWLMGIALTLSTFTNTLFDDILDEPGDRLARIKTLPVVIGVPASYRVLIFAGSLWASTLLVLFLVGLVNGLTFTVLLGLASFPLVYIGLHQYYPKKSRLVEFIMETDLAVFAMGVLLLSI